MQDKWDNSKTNDRALQIKHELVQLFNEQTEFLERAGGRSTRSLKLRNTRKGVSVFEDYLLN
jgi:hypothetical protein